MSELSYKDPSAEQVTLEIEQFLRATQEGDDVAIRNTHGGILLFQIAKVTNTNPSLGRLYTNKAGFSGGSAWFMKSGKNCYYPGGQSTLIMPTQDVRRFIEDHPQGRSLYGRP